MQVYWLWHRIDSSSDFLFTDESYGKNVIIFRADMSSSVHVDNKGKDIVILGEGPIKGLDDTTLTAEERYLLTLYNHETDLH